MDQQHSPRRRDDARVPCLPIRKRTPHRRALGVALCAGLLATACIAQPAPERQSGASGGLMSRADHDGAKSVQAAPGTHWHVANKLASLDGRFIYDSGTRVLRVEYTVTAIGRYPVLVFDRIDTLTLAGGGQAADNVAVPSVSTAGAGDLVLSHGGRTHAPPNPTAPTRPLVTQVLPGSRYANAFSYRVPEQQNANVPVQRVRYCQASIGVPDPLPAADRQTGDIWKVPGEMAARQAELCSPWFVLAEGVFEGGR